MKKILFVLAFLLFLVPASFAADYNLIDNLNCTYTSSGGQADVTLTWDVLATLPLQKILVFRGDQRVAVLDGNTETWTTTETSFGAIQYSVGWVWRRKCFDYQTGVLNLGKLTWDLPSMAVDGFLIYAAIDLDSLTGLTPPEEVLSIDGGTVVEITLKTLLDAGGIVSGTAYYYAAASWMWAVDEDGNPILDENGDPIKWVSTNTAKFTGLAPQATYETMLWDIPTVHGVDPQPVLQW